MPAPLAWDISRHRGDHLFGSFHVTDGARTVAELSWRPARGRFDLDRHARQLSPPLELAGETLQRQLDYLPGRARLFTAPDDEAAVTTLVALWHDPEQRVAATVRVRVGHDAADEDAAATLLAGIVTPRAGEMRDWAALDFHVRSPPGFTLADASLAAGVCHLTFARRRRWVTFRRYSAVGSAIAAPQPDNLERWLRLAYAAAFHDMRYRRHAVTHDDDGLTIRCRAQRRGYGAIEWRGLLPRFRRNAVDLLARYSAAGNCVQCFERGRGVDDDTFAALIASACRQPVADKLPAALRAQALAATVRRRDDACLDRTAAGFVRLRYTVRRPARLRALRLLAAQPVESVRTRTVELDAIGSLIWDRCAQPTPLADLVETVMRALHISAREAILCVTHYVRDLASRGLLTVENAGA